MSDYGGKLINKNPTNNGQNSTNQGKKGLREIAGASFIKLVQDYWRKKLDMNPEQTNGQEPQQTNKKQGASLADRLGALIFSGGKNTFEGP